VSTFRASNLTVEFQPGDFATISTESLSHILTDDIRRGVGVLRRQPITVQTVVPSPLNMPAAIAFKTSSFSPLVCRGRLPTKGPELEGTFSQHGLTK
jgi:hypothetical protein